MCHLLHSAKKESKHFFKFRFFRKDFNKNQYIIYQIKVNLIVFQPGRWTWSQTLRMSEHIHLYVPRYKSKTCKKRQFAIDV